MSGKEPKLLYQSKQYRFRVLLHRDYCREHPIPQEDIIRRCKSKLAELKSEGQIDDHVFDEATYREIWEQLSKVDCPAESVAFTLGLGIPILKWLVIKQGGDDALCKVSLLNSESALALGIQSFIMIVKRKLERANIKLPPNESQLQACYLRLASGWPVDSIPITAQPPYSEAQDKPVTVSVNKTRQEVSLVIRNAKAFSSLSEDSLLTLAKKSALALGEESGSDVKNHPEIFKEVWKDFSTGPVSLGIGLPKSIVIAFGNWLPPSKTQASKTPPANTQDLKKLDASGNPANLPPAFPQPKISVVPKSIEKVPLGAQEVNVSPAQSPGGPSEKPVLQMKLADQNMIARVVDFDRSIYEKEDLTLNEEWLNQQISRLGLAKETHAPYADQILFALESKKDLNGMTLARGEVGTAGLDPYLYPSYKHAKEKFIAEHEGDFIDVRSLQSSEIVKPGDLVAEIIYKTPAKTGRDVFGKVLDAPVANILKVSVGPGLQAKKGGKFFASEPGSPVIKGLSITLQKIYVHQGDVSLKSGNIVFDGPIEIRGNIDQGASVIAKGPISIFGNVEGGVVKSETSIFVQGGVITTDRGKLEAKGDIQVYHVENSRIYCGGTLKVAKVLLNSTVFAGVGVEVAPKEGGIVAGGKISANGHLYTYNLGLKNGTNTYVNIGCDWKTEYSIQISETRMERLSEAVERDRANLRDLSGRKANQLGKKHVEMKAELQKKLIKSRKIIDKLEKRLQDLKSKISVNPKAEIIVRNLLFATAKVKISNKQAIIANDFREVAITPKLRKESYIVSLEEFTNAKKSEADALEIANKK